MTKAMREESALERVVTYLLNYMNSMLACCKVDCRRCRFEGTSEGVEIEFSEKYVQGRDSSESMLGKEEKEKGKEVRIELILRERN